MILLTITTIFLTSVSIFFLLANTTHNSKHTKKSSKVVFKNKGSRGATRAILGRIASNQTLEQKRKYVNGPNSKF